MNKNSQKSSLPLILAVVSLLTIGGAVVARAAGSSASSLAAGAVVKERANNSGSSGAPIAPANKGAKVFGADTTATLVTDEKGVVATAGQIASVEIAYLTGTGTSPCYLMVFDSSVAADTTESGSVSRMLVPPLMVVTSAINSKEFAYPKQFHKGAVVLVGGSGAANCRAAVGWQKIGGSN